MEEIKFEWDENKNDINKKKHKLSYLQYVIAIEKVIVLFVLYQQEKLQQQKQNSIIIFRMVIL